MRKAKRWRYYCDHCKRAGCSGGAMSKHEKHCCGNPNRECRMCGLLEVVQQPIGELLNALDGSFAELKKLADGCPACMLAAIIQRRKRTDYDPAVPDETEVISWDFKEAMKKAYEVIDSKERYWRNVG